MFHSLMTSAVYSYNDNAGHYFANANKKAMTTINLCVAWQGQVMEKRQNLSGWCLPSNATAKFLERLQHGITAAAQASKTKQNQPVWHGATAVASPKQLDAPGKNQLTAMAAAQANKNKKTKQQSTCVAWNPPNDTKAFNRTEKNSSLCIWHSNHQCSSSSEQKTAETTA